MADCNGGYRLFQADSGGPLVIKDAEGTYVTVGIVATGIGCGRPKLPGLYTRVSRYIQWIENTMKSSPAAQIKKWRVVYNRG